MMSPYSPSTRTCRLAHRLLPLVWSVSFLHAQHTETYTHSVHDYAPPPVRLIDTTGHAVKFDAVLGAPGPVVLQFIFTSCTTICPILTATVSAAQNQFGPDVRIVSISIDPENDTPARLAEYAARFRGRREWMFLTGTQKDVTAVQRAFDAADENGKMNHLPLTFLRAAPGAPWVRLEGLTSAADLLAEYRRVVAR